MSAYECLLSELPLHVMVCSEMVKYNFLSTEAYRQLPVFKQNKLMVRHFFGIIQN